MPLRLAQIEEIIVTASKRAESAQDVPISVQAVTGDDLRDLRVETFDQYVEYLPNVVSTGNGPGKKELYIRGSATEQSGVTVAAAQGSAPGVALYVDEQPVSFGARNLDVYAVDAYLNLPLGERLAARVAVYNDTQGGWIDNVAAVFTPSDEVVDRNKITAFGPKMTGADSVQSARNEGLVQDDWNEATYRGARIGFAYDINDDWDLLVQHTSQTLQAEGSVRAVR